MKTKKVVMQLILAAGILLPIFFLFHEFFRSSVDDIWYHTMDFEIALLILIPTFWGEFQIYHSCLYFLSSRTKTPWKNFFNILICIVSSALLFAMIYSYFNFSIVQEYVIAILFLLSVGLRIAYSITCACLNK